MSYCDLPLSEFEILGEALNQLSHVDPDIAEEIPELPRIVAFRNILIHGYASVDDRLVWAVFDLPENRFTIHGDKQRGVIAVDNLGWRGVQL